jgi:hypothetical protein
MANKPSVESDTYYEEELNAAWKQR